MSSNGIVYRRAYTTREFQRWGGDVRLRESCCCVAVAELACGLVDADLGGGLLKKRVAHGGKGSVAVRVWLSERRSQAGGSCWWAI